jgi:hypothetical protein
MTVFIRDISHHQAGISIQALKNAGDAGLIARVGQGTGKRRDGHVYGTTRDREWVRHRDEAKRVGLPLIAYWYVGNLISADENARLASQWVGDTSLPWMIDFEDGSGDIPFYHDVLKAFRNRGLRVVLGYVPRWYWESMGRNSLPPEPPIVNSRYSRAQGTAEQIYKFIGGDNGNGWVDYGGGTTLLWQFTNQSLIAGYKVDCNAFRGTAEEFVNFIGGTVKGEDVDGEFADAQVRKVHAESEAQIGRVNVEAAHVWLDTYNFARSAMDFAEQTRDLLQQLVSTNGLKLKAEGEIIVRPEDPDIQ